MIEPHAAPGLMAAPAAHLEQDEGAGGDPAGADRDHRADPVARVAQGAQLALGELLGPVGELLGRRLGDRAESVSSTRPESRSGGSIGRSASASIRSTSVIVDSPSAPAAV